MSYLGRSAKLSLKAQEKVSFLATAGQTSKTGLSYTPSFVEVYVNGVLLTDTTDFTATNGNSVTFTVALLLNDEVTVISLKTFTVADHYTKSDADTLRLGTQAFNRLSTDGTIVDLQKDGTSVGSIAVVSNRLSMGTGDVGIFFDNLNDRLVPITQDGLADRDAAIDLGYNSSRFKDLYLSGGVYLGGTGAANKLDDYEEGTWTAVGTWATQGTGSTNGGGGTYTKIGDTVHAAVYCTALKGTASGSFHIAGLPFAATDSVPVSLRIDGIGATSKYLMANTFNGNTNISFLLANQSSSYGSSVTPTNMAGTAYIQLQVTYRV